MHAKPQDHVLALQICSPSRVPGGCSLTCEVPFTIWRRRARHNQGGVADVACPGPAGTHTAEELGSWRPLYHTTCGVARSSDLAGVPRLACSSGALSLGGKDDDGLHARVRARSSVPDCDKGGRGDESEIIRPATWRCVWVGSGADHGAGTLVLLCLRLAFVPCPEGLASWRNDTALQFVNLDYACGLNGR
jgi:hypothetical protein